MLYNLICMCLSSVVLWHFGDLWFFFSTGFCCLPLTSSRGSHYLILVGMLAALQSLAHFSGQHDRAFISYWQLLNGILLAFFHSAWILFDKCSVLYMVVMVFEIAWAWNEYPGILRYFTKYWYIKSKIQLSKKVLF